MCVLAQQINETKCRNDHRVQFHALLYMQISACNRVKCAALQCMLLHLDTLSAVICIHPSESDIYHHPIQLYKYNGNHSLNPGIWKCTTCTINSVISTPHQKIFNNISSYTHKASPIILTRVGTAFINLCPTSVPSPSWCTITLVTVHHVLGHNKIVVQTVSFMSSTT